MNVTNKKNKKFDYLEFDDVDYIKDKKLTLIHNVFNDIECNDMIEYSESIGFKQASSYIDKYGKEHVFSEIRKSLRCMVDDDKFPNILYERIKHVIPKYYDNKKFSHINKRLRFLKYECSDHFAIHQDKHYKDDINISLITVLIYLNESYIGGHTKFYTSEKDNICYNVIPHIGLVCLMDQNILHSVPKIENGIKYVMRTELMYEK